MAVRNSKLYHGNKWENITVSEVIKFFGIMLRISIDPWKMEVYMHYFTEYLMINLGHVYYVQIRGYDAWAKYIIILIRFKHILSTFHPDNGMYFCW